MRTDGRADLVGLEALEDVLDDLAGVLVHQHVALGLEDAGGVDHLVDLGHDLRRTSKELLPIKNPISIARAIVCVCVCRACVRLAEGEKKKVHTEVPVSEMALQPPAGQKPMDLPLMRKSWARNCQ